MDAPTLISILLAASALAVAIWSVWYTRRITRIEQERRIEERRPQFEAIVTRPHGADDGRYNLDLQLVSGERLLAVTVEILDTAMMAFSEPIDPDESEQWEPRATTVGLLDVGDTARRLIDLHPERPETVLLRLHSRSTGKRGEWVQVLRVDLPKAPGNIRFM